MVAEWIFVLLEFASSADDQTRNAPVCRDRHQGR